MQNIGEHIFLIKHIHIILILYENISVDYKLSKLKKMKLQVLHSKENKKIKNIFTILGKFPILKDIVLYNHCYLVSYFSIIILRVVF
jgi:hypothetical protein